MTKPKGSFEKAAHAILGPVVDRMLKDLAHKLENSIKNNTPFSFRDELAASSVEYDVHISAAMHASHGLRNETCKECEAKENDKNEKR